MSTHTLPIWQHTDNGLLVRWGQRRDRLPEPISDWLVGPSGIGLSGDPAHDLLRLEGRIRRVITQLTDQIGKVEQRITAHGGAEPTRGQAPQRRPRRVARALQAALDERAELVDSRESSRTVLDLLRTYVIELDPPQGLLREAADGWRRRPDPPASVVVFEDEDSFLDADPRRATMGSWGGPTIAGVEQFGFAWRRDSDEDDPADLGADDDIRRGGPWQLGYIQRTGEVYGIRRCGYLSRQVWLLGAGFDTLSMVRDVLVPIMPRLVEPNSLILAACTVHAAQLWRRSLGEPVPPSPGGSHDAATDAR
jgi:hypothetical protein